MGGITIKQVNTMQPGTKVLADVGVYLRRNLDNTVTAWCRAKREGKSVDVKAGVESLPVTSGQLKDLLTAASQARRAEAKRRPAAPALPGSTLGPLSTVQATWDDMLVRIEDSGKWAKSTADTNEDRVKRYLEPSKLWNLAVADVKPLDVLTVLSPMSRTPDQQRKVRGLLSLVFTHAMGAGLRMDNPALGAGAVLRVTSKTTRAKHFPTVTDWNRLRAIYRQIDTLDSKGSTRAALRLQSLTCQRSGEVLGALWSEINLQAGIWTLARSRMKMKDGERGAHVVPLSAQAVALLSGLPRGSAYVFPGRKDQPTSENTLPQVMRRDMGLTGEFVPHSWRSALKTLATRAVGDDGRPMFAASWIESILDHQKEDKVDAAYDRGQHLDGARRVLDWWSAQLVSA